VPRSGCIGGNDKKNESERMGRDRERGLGKTIFRWDIQMGACERPEEGLRPSRTLRDYKSASSEIEENSYTETLSKSKKSPSLDQLTSRMSISIQLRSFGSLVMRAFLGENQLTVAKVSRKKGYPRQV